MKKLDLMICGCFFSSLTLFAHGVKKPNVIILFSDQHRADVLGLEGHPDVKTPNLDNMIKKGVIYSRAYCQDAISAPSRASMFTGLYPRTLGYLDNSSGTTSVIEQSIPLQLTLQSHGYDTYAFGKRHLSGKVDQGWGIHKSHLANESPKDNYVKWIEQQGFADEFGQDWAAEFGQYPHGNSLSARQYPRADMGTRATKLDENHTMEAYSALNAIDVIKSSKDKENPFFCFVSFYRPHQPYCPLLKYLSMYNIERWGSGNNNSSSIYRPATLSQNPAQLPPFLAKQRVSFNGIWCLGKAAADEQLYRDYMGAYYALVTEIDSWVGKIIKELEDNGVLENTILIYTSDHGDFVGNHGMIEKAAAGHNIYEETLRVPLIIYWKGKLLSGYRSEELVELVDIYPTILDLVNIPYPKMEYPLQGVSLVNNLKKKANVGRKYIVSENWSQATVVTKEHKLGIWLNPSPKERSLDFREFRDMLFDSKKDCYEVDNCIDNPKYAKVKQSLYRYFSHFESNVSGKGKAEMSDNIRKKHQVR